MAGLSEWSVGVRGVSLRARWTAVLLLTAAVPLAVLALITLRIQRDGLTRAERDTANAVIAHVTDTLERDLEFASEAMRTAGTCSPTPTRAAPPRASASCERSSRAPRP
ncbi:MAG: hypothetical protein U0325_35685 [Polyangiales bacterium]